MTPRSAEEIAREAREIALDAVQSADRAFELCACKSEHRLIEALASRIAAALVARAEAAERRVRELEKALSAALERMDYAVAVLGGDAGNIVRAADIVWDVDNGLLPTLPDALKPQALGIREVASQIEHCLTALAEHLRALRAEIEEAR